MVSTVCVHIYINLLVFHFQNTVSNLLYTVPYKEKQKLQYVSGTSQY
jgi:hypothetical protein